MAIATINPKKYRGTFGPVIMSGFSDDMISIEYPEDAFDDIIDIGKIAFHITVIENIDRLPGQDSLGEQEKRHVRSPPGSIDREEPQPCGRQLE